jgi:predicted kinase
MKPDFIMTIGIPGCGKSTWIKTLSGEEALVCPDSIRKELSGDISDQTLNTKVWVIAKERVVGALKAGHDVILDATNVSTYHRNLFIKDLPPCTLLAKVFDVEPAVAYGRIAHDVKNGVDRSNVPEDVVYRMYGEFLYTKRVLSKEGFKLIQ